MLRITTPENDVRFWVFQHIKEIAAANPGLLSQMPVFNPGLFNPVIFSLKRIEKKYFTGLHVVSDQGIPFVIIGGIIMAAGLLVIFFLPYQRIWVRMEQTEKNILIKVAGRSNRNNAGMAMQMDKLSGRIKEKMSS